VVGQDICVGWSVREKTRLGSASYVGKAVHRVRVVGSLLVPCSYGIFTRCKFLIEIDGDGASIERQISLVNR